MLVRSSYYARKSKVISTKAQAGNARVFPRWMLRRVVIKFSSIINTALCIKMCLGSLSLSLFIQHPHSVSSVSRLTHATAFLLMVSPYLISAFNLISINSPHFTARSLSLLCHSRLPFFNESQVIITSPTGVRVLWVTLSSHLPFFYGEPSCGMNLRSLARDVTA
jgi:hypothetical protein